VVPDTTVDGAGQKLAEVVVLARHASLENDTAEQVIGGRAAGCADPVLAVEVPGRLGFGQGIGAGPETHKAIGAAGGGRGRGVDRLAEVVGPGQVDGSAADAGLTSLLDAVIVG